MFYNLALWLQVPLTMLNSVEQLETFALKRLEYIDEILCKISRI